MDGLEGRQVTIFYDDGTSISRKDGILTKHTSDGYLLDNRILIPTSRVIRIEVKE